MSPAFHARDPPCLLASCPRPENVTLFTAHGGTARSSVLTSLSPPFNNTWSSNRGRMLKVPEVDVPLIFTRNVPPARVAACRERHGAAVVGRVPVTGRFNYARTPLGGPKADQVTPSLEAVLTLNESSSLGTTPRVNTHTVCGWGRNAEVLVPLRRFFRGFRLVLFAIGAADVARGVVTVVRPLEVVILCLFVPPRFGSPPGLPMPVTTVVDPSRRQRLYMSLADFSGADQWLPTGKGSVPVARGSIGFCVRSRLVRGLWRSSVREMCGFYWP